MIIDLPPPIHRLISARAELLGITLDEAVRQAISLYTSTVSDTASPRLGFTTREVALMLGLSTKTILRLAEAGTLTPNPHSKRRFIFSRKEVERFSDSVSVEKKRPTRRNG